MRVLRRLIRPWLLVQKESRPVLDRAEVSRREDAAKRLPVAGPLR